MRRATLAALFLSFALIAGCGGDESTRPVTGEADRYLPRTSPENVLTNLERAHAYRDIEGYSAQLHDPLFTFSPSLDDPDLTYDHLDIHQDLEITRRMFEQTDDIDLTLRHGGSTPSDVSVYPAEAGFRMIQVPAVYLRIVTREIIEGDPLILMVSNDPARFIFAPDSTTSPVTYTIIHQLDAS